MAKSKTVTFFNLSTRKKVRVPRSKTRRVTLKNKAVALQAIGKGGVKLSKIVKGSKTGRRK